MSTPPEYMTWMQAFDWLTQQEGEVMSDTRAAHILSFATEAGRAPANSTDWLEHEAGKGFCVRRDPAGVRQFREMFREQTRGKNGHS